LSTEYQAQSTETKEKRNRSKIKVNCHTKKRQNVQKNIDILNFSKSLELEARSLKLIRDKAGAGNGVRFPGYLRIRRLAD
jgi:hypothetical protein